MTDEEKKAIEWLKKADWFSSRLYSPTILNLIEKQQKQIEKLKEKCKELIFEKQGLTSALLDSTPNDKIKEKIEEYEKNRDKARITSIEYDIYVCIIEVLQSLLEKE